MKSGRIVAALEREGMNPEALFIVALLPARSQKFTTALASASTPKIGCRNGLIPSLV